MGTCGRIACLAAGCLVVAAAGCGAKDARESERRADYGGHEAPPGDGKLEVVDEKVGDGPEAGPGMRLTVHYTGMLADGKKFNSSYDTRNKEPLTFTQGAGEVIKGWDQGVVGMRVGGKRKLVIPPQLAFGEGGFLRIVPPNATVVFEVELLKAESPRSPQPGVK
jgi:FKBP-type peptidyl-prolyl cis-trans isomerase